MASRSTRRALLTIGLAHGIADSLEKSYEQQARNKTMMAYIERIRAHCQDCFTLWPDQITPKEVKQIEQSMVAIESRTIQDGKMDCVVLTSIMLAMLDDMRRRVGGRKSEAVERLLSAYQQVHRYFDRQLDRHQQYRSADMAVREMEGFF